MSFDARRSVLLLGLLALTLALGLIFWLGLLSPREHIDAPDLTERTENVAPREALTAPSALATDARSKVARVEPTAPEANAAPSAPTPSAEFLVQVVDHEDRPLRDVPVQVMVHYRGGSFGNMSSSSARARKPASASEEFLRIPRSEVEAAFSQAQEFLAKSEQKPSFEIAMECQIASTSATRHVLSSAEPPAEMIRLKLAPSGRVRVEIRDLAGELAKQAFTVRLRRTPLGLTPLEEMQLGHAGTIESAVVTEGSVLFPHVAVGQVLHVEVEDRESRMRTARVRVDGPIDPQSEVLVNVQVGQENPVLIGRLVDASDSPVADRRISISIVRGSSSRGTWLRTDRDGNFEQAWTEAFGDPSSAEAIAFGWEEEVPAPGAPLSARMLCPKIPPTGRVELGTIALRAPSNSAQALLVSGRVVDGAGQPLPRAGLTFYSLWPLVRQGPWEEMEALTGSLPERTDDQGRFVAHVPKLPRGVRVDARLEGYYLQSSLLCEPGRQDVELVLRRGAVLKGKLLFDPEIDPSAIQVSFGDDKRTHAQTRSDAEGNFELRALRPGYGELRIGIAGWTAKVIAGISIPEEADAVEDPRCASIDLRGTWRSWAFKLEGLNWSLPRATAFLFDAANASQSSFLYFDLTRRASAWLPVGVEEIDFVFAECAPSRLRYSADEHLVKLQREPAVIVEVPASFQIPDGYVLELSLDAPREAPLSPLERRRMTYGAAAFDARGRAEFRVPKSGSYLFRWTLRSKLDNRQERIAEVAEAIELGAEGATMVRTPPSDGLARALAKWG
jgi:hypothetical protein